MSHVLDNGADRSVVHPSVVEPNEWLGKKIKVKGVHGNVVESPLARVWLHTGDYSICLVVVAIENTQDKVLIGRDIAPVLLMLQEIENSTSENIENSKEFVDSEDKVEGDASVLVTRNQSKKKEAEQRK